MSTDQLGRSADRDDDGVRRPSPNRRRRVRVLAADGHPLYRDAMSRAIRERPELELVAQAADGRGALEAINAQEPDVALLERDLPGLTGEQVLNAVDRDGLETRVLLISAEPASDGVYLAIANGAAGYLTKDAEARDICDAITAVARGQTILAPELQAGIAGEIRLRAVDERPFMSEREQEVLKLIAAGMTAPQIARSIHLSTATVKTHLQHIYDKLGVSERAAAVAEAMRRGLLE
jgi:two-component system, NarL family, nitrate/nitrite response regulator NarL